MIVFGWMFESVFLESWGLSVRGIDDYEVPPQSLDGLNTHTLKTLWTTIRKKDEII